MSKEYDSALRIVENINTELNNVDLNTSEGRTIFVNILIQFGMISHLFSVERLNPSDFLKFQTMADKLQEINYKYINNT